MFILFLFGVSIGSFLNVLILLYDPESALFNVRRLWGRSQCIQCKRQLVWWELIPLASFLFLRGKCRVCHTSLSLQYPLVEFVSGAIVAGIPAFFKYFLFGDISFFSATTPFLSFGFFVLCAVWILAFLAFLVMIAIDIRHYIIPDELNLVVGILGIISALLFFFYKDALLPFRTSFIMHYALLFFPISHILLAHGIGSIVAGGLFSALSILSRGRAMGFGDAKLAFAAGLLLGWPDIMLAIILSFIFGGLVGGYYLFRRARTMKDRLPFAPFFVLGIVCTVFFGAAIVQGYFALFGA